MEIPRHWRITRLLGYSLKGTTCEDNHNNFPPNRPVCLECGKPTKKHPLANTDVYNSALLSPDNQVVHGEVVRKNQE